MSKNSFFTQIQSKPSRSKWLKLLIWLKVTSLDIFVANVLQDWKKKQKTKPRPLCSSNEMLNLMQPYQVIIIVLLLLLDQSLKDNYNISCDLHEDSHKGSNKSSSMNVHMEGIGYVVNGCMKVRGKPSRPSSAPRLLNYLEGWNLADGVRQMNLLIKTYKALFICKEARWQWCWKQHGHVQEMGNGLLNILMRWSFYHRVFELFSSCAFKLL